MHAFDDPATLRRARPAEIAAGTTGTIGSTGKVIPCAPQFENPS
jgi:hypothetical protein